MAELQNCNSVSACVQITSNVFDSVVASVTLSFMRRAVGLPLIVVTQNSTNSPVSGLPPLLLLLPLKTRLTHRDL